MIPPAFAQCKQVEVASPAEFRSELARENRPLVLRGAVADWPLIAHGRQSPEALVGYLAGLISSEVVDTVIAPPAARGRLLYEEGLSSLNHQHSIEKLSHVLRGLLKQIDAPEPIGISIQGLDANEHLRGLEQANSTDLVPPGTQARLWIGNAVTVAPHFDAADNLACVAAGRRRFILFPPEQVGNLYVGPFDVTPAGVPVSTVPLDDPDLDRWPRYRNALAAAEVAELDPGDAIYIPYLWWHGVQSLEPFNLLVNYWWYCDPVAAHHPYGALLRACHALFGNMPDEHRAAWRALYDHYVFSPDAASFDHLPPQFRSAPEPGAEAIAQFKEAIAGLFGRS